MQRDSKVGGERTKTVSNGPPPPLVSEPSFLQDLLGALQAVRAGDLLAQRDRLRAVPCLLSLDGA